MKKIIIIAVAAVAAIAVFTAKAGTTNDSPVKGTVSFESSVMPALNCTMSIDQVWDIYRLIPLNIDDVCRNEYINIRQKCESRAHFTHEGVDVQTKDVGGNVSIVFSYKGYKLTVKNVTWRELDNMFIGSDGNS